MLNHLDKDTALQKRLEDIEIVYTDLDGTLLGRGGTLLIDGEGSPSARTAQAVVAANSAGLKIVPVTGRSCAQLTEITRLCGWTDYIAELGSIRSTFADGERTFTFDTPEWRKPLPHGVTPLDIIRESQVVDKLAEAFPGRIEYHTPWHVHRQASEVLRGYLDRQQALEIIDGLDVKLSLIDNGVITPRKHTLGPSDEPIRAYHIAPAGVSKQRAIALDLKERGINPKHALMIGDAPSDLKCSEVVFTVLVENALRSPGLEKRLERDDNACLVTGMSGDGWARVIDAVLAKRR